MNPISTERPIGVVGAGTMGAGIAQVAAAAGHRVYLVDARDNAAVEAVGRIRAGLERLVNRERMSAADADALCARIRPSVALAELRDCALVVEAISEDIGVKQQVFAELESHCGKDAILATNTSSLSVTAIAASLTHPQRLAGMHFFNPAQIMRLVEVVSGAATAPAVVETVYATARAWGKTPVHARATPGFIVNRVARPYYAEALRLLDEGAADVATIDAIAREAGGFPMGPFELMDLIGHDVNYAVTCSMHQSHYGDSRFLPSLRQKELVDAGWLGRKSGRGFYNYADGAAVCAPLDAVSAPAPEQCRIEGDLGPAHGLVAALREAGVSVVESEGRGLVRLPSVTLALTDGRLATLRQAEEGVENLVLFDLAEDYSQLNRIAIAPADGVDPAAVSAACGLFQQLGARVSVMDDTPGLIVMRTVCMLANEAADAVLQSVCSASDCDTAMRAGLNYPRGPLAWADLLGPSRVVEVLDNMAADYGLDRYRTSLLLRRCAATGHALVPMT